MDARQETFPAPASGGRLDLILLTAYPDQSRSRVQEWIQHGLVTVDGKSTTRPGMRLRGGETIGVRRPAMDAASDLPEDIPLDIVFENEDVIVINKPPGMVVHPSAGHASGTIVNAILGHAPDLAGVGGERRPGIVHRLDRDTSGLLVVAKNESTLRLLQSQFHDRSVVKTYLALVDGRPPDRRGRIEAPIGRDPRHRQRMAIVPSARGRAAATEYRLQQSFPSHTLLEVTPHTGRTHQIRVHLAFLRCPIVGDRVYGLRRPTLAAARQMLHAWRLRLSLPSDPMTERTFEAAMPADMVLTIARASKALSMDGTE